MPHNDLVWQSFLSLDSVKLGRLVLNLDEPHQDYLDPKNNLSPEVIERPRLRYVDFENAGGSKGFTAELTALALASRSRQKMRLAMVTTGQSTIYQLANSGRWFKASLQNQETRDWIEEVNKTGDDIYLVVGYQTMIDAQAQGQSGASKNTKLRLQLPAAEVVTSTLTVVPSLGSVADPAVEVHHQEDHLLHKQLVAPGEQVYAVQYRKVRFKWYSSRDTDNASLEKGSRWRVHGVIRGQEIGTNDMLEATVSEDEDSDGEEILSSEAAEAQRRGSMTNVSEDDRLQATQSRGAGLLGG